MVNWENTQMTKVALPFVFWELRDLDPLVNAVGRGILVGRFLRCLLSSGGVYAISKELKHKDGRYGWAPLCWQTAEETNTTIPVQCPCMGNAALGAQPTCTSSPRPLPSVQAGPAGGCWHHGFSPSVAALIGWVRGGVCCQQSVP